MALWGPATDDEVLHRFCRTIHPGGSGWQAVRRRAVAAGEDLPAGASELPLGIACMALGSIAVYAALFATGLFLYGRSGAGFMLATVGVAAAVGVVRLWRRRGA